MTTKEKIKEITDNISEKYSKMSHRRALEEALQEMSDWKEKVCLTAYCKAFCNKDREEPCEDICDDEYKLLVGIKQNEYKFPKEEFGHCDEGTSYEVCQYCPNCPFKCAYMEFDKNGKWMPKKIKE